MMASQALVMTKVPMKIPMIILVRIYEGGVKILLVRRSIDILVLIFLRERVKDRGMLVMRVLIHKVSKTRKVSTKGRLHT